jgi:hypothetical protein
MENNIIPANILEIEGCQHMQIKRAAQLAFGIRKQPKSILSSW